MTGPADPGLQAERTSLAWTRTAVALVAVALLVLRVAERLGAAGIGAIAVATVGAVLIVAAHRRRYRRASASLREERGDPAITATIAMSGGAVLLGIVAMAAILGRALR